VDEGFSHPDDDDRSGFAAGCCEEAYSTSLNNTNTNWTFLDLTAQFGPGNLGLTNESFNCTPAKGEAAADWARGHAAGASPFRRPS
jgi:hypothetical protein